MVSMWSSITFKCSGEISLLGESAGHDILGEDVNVRTLLRLVGVEKRVHWFGAARMEWLRISYRGAGEGERERECERSCDCVWVWICDVR